jgi:uncharacterized membrane protein
MNEHGENSTLSFERILFFSDAVFAIVITLLVLEIKVPHIANATDTLIRGELLHMIPKFLGFIFSFFIIGLLWFEHHRIFRYINNYNAGLIWRNLVFLLFISFIPFPTALFSEYSLSTTAFLIYAVVFGLAGLAKLWVWNYAVAKAFLPDNFDNLHARRISRRSLGVPLGCLVCVIFGLIFPTYFAILGFPFISLFAWLLDPTKKAKIETPDEIQDS